MSKATAGVEIPELAKKHGFNHYEQQTNHVPGDVGKTEFVTRGFFHKKRREGFVLASDGTNAFLLAYWYAPDEYITVLDRRAPGEHGKEGRSLVSNGKRRSVGMDEVRPERIASQDGMDIGYLDLKRRIKNPDWREVLKKW